MARQDSAAPSARHICSRGDLKIQSSVGAAFPEYAAPTELADFCWAVGFYKDAAPTALKNGVGSALVR